MQGWTDKLFGWETSPSSDRKCRPNLDCAFSSNVLVRMRERLRLGRTLIDAEGERDWDSTRPGGLGHGMIREAAEVGDSESETECRRQGVGAVMPAGGGSGVVFFGFCGMEFCGWLPWIAIEWWA